MFRKTVSDDRGVDIVAERDDVRCAVQVKRHRGLISRHAVSDVVGGMKQYGCDAAMVITNSYFTEAAVAQLVLSTAVAP